MMEQGRPVEIPEDVPLKQARKATTKKRVKPVNNMAVIEAKLDALLKVQGISPLSVERELNETN